MTKSAEPVVMSVPGTLSEILRKEYPVFFIPIVVNRARYSLVLPGGAFDLEAHLRVKCDRTGIYRRRNAPDRGAAACADGLEERLVEPPAKPALAMVRVGAYEMDVGLVRVGLGDETCQKANQDSLTELIRQECKSEIHSLKEASSDVPVDLFVHFLASTFMSLLTWWLDRRSRLSPQQARWAPVAILCRACAAV